MPTLAIIGAQWGDEGKGKITDYLAEDADIGLATVYRVLTQFEQADILKRRNFESGKAVYELNEGQHHDHLVCLDCGRVEEFFDADIEKRQHQVAKIKGFKLADHALSLYAHCTKDHCSHRPPPKRGGGGDYDGPVS